MALVVSCRWAERRQRAKTAGQFLRKGVDLKRSLALILAGFLCLTIFPCSSGAGQPKLTVGIIPELNLLKQMDRYIPLLSYLGRKIGQEIEAKPISSYGKIYEKMRDGEIDAGFFGSFVYALTRARLDIEPLARPQRLDGISTYGGMTFVRKESGIRRPEDMRGKTIALVDPATTGGYLAQKVYLRSHGIDLDKDLTVIWTGSHDEVINKVLRNQADIGGAKNNTVNSFRRLNPAFDKSILILNENPKPQVPENTLAVRKGLDPLLVAKLKTALLKMHEDPEGRKVLARFGAARFIATRDEDFRPLYDLTRQLHIDLKTYPYLKR
jgi:phosphonate transport system substrate-binding protein